MLWFASYEDLPVAPLVASLRLNSQVGTITEVLGPEALERQASCSQS